MGGLVSGQHDRSGFRRFTGRCCAGAFTRQSARGVCRAASNLPRRDAAVLVDGPAPGVPRGWRRMTAARVSCLLPCWACNRLREFLLDPIQHGVEPLKIRRCQALISLIRATIMKPPHYSKLAVFRARRRVTTIIIPEPVSSERN